MPACRRSAFLLGSLVLMAASTPRVASAQSSWYVGGSAGQSRIDASTGEIESGFLIDDAFTASGTTLDKSDTGWKAYAGWRFNQFLAAEAGYADLGKASFNTTIVAAPSGTVPTPPFALQATAKARGVFLSALVHWPFLERYSVFAKAGVFRSEAEFTETIPSTGATRVSRTERHTDANFGAGLQWQVLPAMSVRVEWERFQNVGRGIGGREGRDVDFASAGLMVSF
jgi:OmpA-OmpF porin, OOP family